MVSRPTHSIAGTALAHERLSSTIFGFTDASLSSPSLLPGWSVGHVVAHLALNAEAMVKRIEAALRGDLVEQYAGGPQGRAASIDATASLPAAELVTRSIEAAQTLDAIFDALPEQGWQLPVLTVAGDTHAIELLPFRRWREVEVHLVDMNLGYQPADWPIAFVDLALPRLIGGIEARTDRRQLGAWLLGRGDPPDLQPWA